MAKDTNIILNKTVVQVAEDIAKRINETNNIDYITVNEEGDIVFPCKENMILTVTKGKSTNGEFMESRLYAGGEEYSVDTFYYSEYERFINASVDLVNEILNRRIKIVTYSKRFKYWGKEWYYMNDNEEWEKYDEFKMKTGVTRLFIYKNYTKEQEYDFRIS